jgi:hypothetical protein
LNLCNSAIKIIKIGRSQKSAEKGTGNQEILKKQKLNMLFKGHKKSGRKINCRFFRNNPVC